MEPKLLSVESLWSFNIVETRFSHYFRTHFTDEYTKPLKIKINYLYFFLICLLNLKTNDLFRWYTKISKNPLKCLKTCIFYVFTFTKLGKRPTKVNKTKPPEWLIQMLLHASALHPGNMFIIKTSFSKSGSMVYPNNHRMHTLYNT